MLCHMARGRGTLDDNPLHLHDYGCAEPNPCDHISAMHNERLLGQQEECGRVYLSSRVVLVIERVVHCRGAWPYPYAAS